MRPRRVLLAAALLAGGCVHPTPMMTPETLALGRTRVEAGLGAPFQPSVRVRHGLGERLEAGARADVFLVNDDDPVGAVVLGGDASVQVVRPPAPGGVGVVANLGVSGTLATRRPSGAGFVYVYPAVVVGAETVYGGVRGLVPLDDLGESGVGPFVGLRVPASSGVSRYYVGVEAAAVWSGGGDGLSVVPALTLGRRQNR